MLSFPRVASSPRIDAFSPPQDFPICHTARARKGAPQIQVREGRHGMFHRLACGRPRTVYLSERGPHFPPLRVHLGGGRGWMADPPVTLRQIICSCSSLVLLVSIFRSCAFLFLLSSTVPDFLYGDTIETCTALALAQAY